MQRDFAIRVLHDPTLQSACPFLPDDLQRRAE